MKRRSSKILLGLSAICLLAIGGIIFSGLLKGKNSQDSKNQFHPEVLGQIVDSQIIPTAESGVKGVVQEVWQNSKEEVSQKVETVKSEIMQSIQKEVNSLTESQIDALKIQVCRDLGVLPSIPPTPKP